MTNRPTEPIGTRNARAYQVAARCGTIQRSPAAAETAKSSAAPTVIATAFSAIGGTAGNRLMTTPAWAAPTADNPTATRYSGGTAAAAGARTITATPATAIVAPSTARHLKRSRRCATERTKVKSGTAPNIT